MTINYRLATNDDVEIIYEFALKAIADSVLPKFAEDAGFDLQARLSSGATQTILALEGEDIVAYSEVDTSESHKAVYILGVYVLPSHRREGIGGKILKMIRNELCKSGEKIRSRAFTTAGRHFWESLNFKVHHYSMELKE